MNTKLNFEDNYTKELLSKLDLDYFLKQNSEMQNYSAKDMDDLYRSYNETLGILKIKYKENKKQSNYFFEGQVRKMFVGGFLPSLFHLNDSRNFGIIAFSEVGEELAYFKLWQKYFKRKIIVEKYWNVFIKTSSVLAVILTIIKIWEILIMK